MNENTKQSKFLEAINRFAEEQQKKLLDEVSAYKAERVELATEDGLRDAYELIQREIAEKKSQIVRETAKMEQDARNELFSMRRKMTDEVIKKSEDKLIAFTESSDYADKLYQSAEKIRKIAGSGELIVSICEKDADKAEKLSELLSPCTIKTDKSIRIGGLSAYVKDKGILLDDTYDGKLRDERARFIDSCPMKVV